MWLGCGNSKWSKRRCTIESGQVIDREEALGRDGDGDDLVVDCVGGEGLVFFFFLFFLLWVVVVVLVVVFVIFIFIIFSFVVVLVGTTRPKVS